MGNVSKHPAPRTPSRNKVASMGLEGVRIAARRDKTVRFTALLHHVTPQLLVQSFQALRRLRQASRNSHALAIATSPQRGRQGYGF